MADTEKCVNIWWVVEVGETQLSAKGRISSCFVPLGEDEATEPRQSQPRCGASLEEGNACHRDRQSRPVRPQARGPCSCAGLWAALRELEAPLTALSHLCSGPPPLPALLLWHPVSLCIGPRAELKAPRGGEPRSLVEVLGPNPRGLPPEGPRCGFLAAEQPRGAHGGVSYGAALNRGSGGGGSRRSSSTLTPRINHLRFRGLALGLGHGKGSYMWARLPFWCRSKIGSKGRFFPLDPC